MSRPPEFEELDWRQIRGVVFDLDGTLYHQGKLRKKMLGEIVAALWSGQLSLRQLHLISYYRRCREYWARQNTAGLGRRQYEAIAKKFRLQPATVESLIVEWLNVRPLKHLPACRVAGVDTLFARLRAQKIRIGIFSDYPIENKLAALGLEADAVSYSLEPEIDRLKPNPAVLSLIVHKLGLASGTYIVIGDREERDGECARLLKARFLRRQGADFFIRLVSAIDRSESARGEKVAYVRNDLS